MIPDTYFKYYYLKFEIIEQIFVKYDNPLIVVNNQNINTRVPGKLEAYSSSGLSLKHCVIQHL